MESQKEMAHLGMSQPRRGVYIQNINYRYYMSQIAKMEEKYLVPEDANYEIYEFIMEETGNEVFAGKIHDRAERHLQAIRTAEYRRGYNNHVREDRQRITHIRDELGSDVVSQIQVRIRAAKKSFHVGVVHDDSSRREAALAQWDSEEKELERLYGIVNDARNLRFDQSVQEETERRRRANTVYEPPFSLPKSIDVNRNITLYKRACSGFAKGDSPESVWAVLEIENRNKCYEPLSDKELQQLFKSAEKKHLRNEKMRSASIKLRFTDTANGDRLIEDHGERLRYIQSLDKWIFFDGTRWLFETPGGLFPLVRLTIEGLLQYAITLEGDERTLTLREITALESVAKQKAMIEMASKIPAVIIQPDNLDHDSFLLNVCNGTLDLKIGVLRETRADDFITKLAPVIFDPSAKCPVFTIFLERIMNGNQNLINFLQRAIGYSLTGDTSEQCLFFLYGNGANGKSTLMNIIRTLLSDYATQAAPDILMAKEHQGGASPELARLPGVRFLGTSETEDNQRFAEASIKQMTGQDTITARFLYKEFFEFKPQFKIWFGTNHKPIIKGTDKWALIMQGRYSHARQMNRAKREQKRLKVFLGRVIRDIRRKCAVPSGLLATMLERAQRIFSQKQNDKNKLYSLQAPEVECIAKGKAHKKYEFGCKVSLVSTSQDNWIIGAQAIHGNPYDGHTLKEALNQAQQISGWRPQHAYCDRGYKGTPSILNNTAVHLAGKKKRSMKIGEWQWYKRRSAIEPIIGHVKSDHRMDRNYLKGEEGDKINAILAGCGFNIRKLLRAILLWLFKERFRHSLTDWVALTRILERKIQPV